jgi:hypothetical protein
MAFTNEDLIAAYRETGSVWKAGKLLGIPGQNVHSRLSAIGYKFANGQWTEEELEELKELAGHFTIAQIASKLGRPYNGVAIKISRLGLSNRYGNSQRRKPPKVTKWSKASVAKYVEDIDQQQIKITRYATQNNLPIELLVRAIQNHQPLWWLAYCEKNAVKPKTECPYCKTDFWPLSKKQIYCSRSCANDSRTDNGYFGGRRRETIGLAEKICQLCARKNVKGLSSHHMIGKENDPDNEYLIALCPGCHQLVTLLGGRNFAGTPEVWEALIQLAMIRKLGDNKEMAAIFCSVEIELISKDKLKSFED